MINKSRDIIDWKRQSPIDFVSFQHEIAKLLDVGYKLKYSNKVTSLNYCECGSAEHFINLEYMNLAGKSQCYDICLSCYWARLLVPIYED